MTVYAETVLDRLTEKQATVLEFLRWFIGANGYPPTLRDLCKRFRWSSPNAASDHLQALKAKGAIAIVPGVSRGIRVLI
jgi:repressor LexA